MLLEVRLENFKSFRKKSVFSLVPQHGLKDLDYSLLREQGRKRAEVLVLINYCGTKCRREIKLLPGRTHQKLSNEPRYRSPFIGDLTRGTF